MAHSTYKPEYCDKIEEHLSKGYSVESCAGILGVCKQTIFTWFEKHEDFKAAKDRGVEKSRVFWERLGLAGCIGNIKGFNAAIWIFNMKNRFKWADRQLIEGDGNGPDVIKLAYLVTNEPKE